MIEIKGTPTPEKGTLHSWHGQPGTNRGEKHARLTLHGEVNSDGQFDLPIDWISGTVKLVVARELPGHPLGSAAKLNLFCDLTPLIRAKLHSSGVAVSSGTITYGFSIEAASLNATAEFCGPAMLRLFNATAGAQFELVLVVSSV